MCSVIYIAAIFPWKCRKFTRCEEERITRQTVSCMIFKGSGHFREDQGKKDAVSQKKYRRNRKRLGTQYLI